MKRAGWVLDVALLILAVLRASRFLTADKLGEWWADRPARDWANRHDRPEAAISGDPVNPDYGWRSKLVSGLECPFCGGFHLGWLGLATLLIARRQTGLHGLWRAVAGVFALNYLVGHIGSRLDE